MWKSLKHNALAEKDTVELAKELVDFEEKSIERLKEYLELALIRVNDLAMQHRGSGDMR